VSPAVRAFVEAGLARLPFADAASRDLPLGRLLRLSLFQLSAGMALVLMTGTLNRVMIVELRVPAALVALVLALPYLSAPFRALFGHRSDHHRSAFGWRRVPYLWNGTLLQFAGLAIMPFAIILLNGDYTGSLVRGRVGTALAFLLLGVGTHLTQTAGLALASDLADERSRPRVVALLHLMLLAGMLGSALVLGALLQPYRPVRLIQVVSAAAVLTVVLNVTALWKQEARDRQRAQAPPPAEPFRAAWRRHTADRRTVRLLVAVALGTIGFGMQDVLLEPFGAQVLGLSVSGTTLLTALSAGGALAAFALAARRLSRGADPGRLAGAGALTGCFALAAVVFAAPLASPALFRAGAFGLGFGGGLFAVATLTLAMLLARQEGNGLALGAWGAVQATAAGVALGSGGGLRDLFARLAESGALGPALATNASAYLMVYHLEIAALFATLVALGPLVLTAREGATRTPATEPFGLAELPG